MNPWRAALTSATASGKRTRIASRQSDRLLVGAALDRHPLQSRAGQLDRGVQRQRRELLALGLGDRLRLACRELLQVLHQLVGIAAERESETAFHASNDSDAAHSSVARSSSRRRERTPRPMPGRCFIASANGEPGARAEGLLETPRRGSDSVEVARARPGAVARRSPARERARLPRPPRSQADSRSASEPRAAHEARRSSPPPALLLGQLAERVIDTVRRTHRGLRPPLPASSSTSHVRSSPLRMRRDTCARPARPRPDTTPATPARRPRRTAAGGGTVEILPERPRRQHKLGRMALLGALPAGAATSSRRSARPTTAGATCSRSARTLAGGASSSLGSSAGPGDEVLDVATGTAAVAIELARENGLSRRRPRPERRDAGVRPPSHRGRRARRPNPPRRGRARSSFRSRTAPSTASRSRTCSATSRIPRTHCASWRGSSGRAGSSPRSSSDYRVVSGGRSGSSTCASDCLSPARLISPGWHEVGAFLGPSIRDLPRPPAARGTARGSGGQPGSRTSAGASAQPRRAATSSGGDVREREPRPAFYALEPGGWRDYVTLLHPPYTLWHLSYVVIGAALAAALRDRPAPGRARRVLPRGRHRSARARRAERPSAGDADLRPHARRARVVSIGGCRRARHLRLDRLHALARAARRCRRVRRLSRTTSSCSAARSTPTSGSRVDWGSFPLLVGYVAMAERITARSSARGHVRGLPEPCAAAPVDPGANRPAARGLGSAARSRLLDGSP